MGNFFYTTSVVRGLLIFISGVLFFTQTAYAAVSYSQTVTLDPGWNIVSTPRLLESHSFSAPETIANFSIYTLDPAQASGWATMADVGQSEFIPLDGYFINNKTATSQTLTFNYKASTTPNERLFERTFTQEGWYSFGIANPSYAKAQGDNTTDIDNPDHILNSLLGATSNYDSVVDFTDASFVTDPDSVALVDQWNLKIRSADVTDTTEINSLNDFRETKGYAIYIKNPGAILNGFQNADIPQCADGIDNDGDGKVDFPDDLGCTSALDTGESNLPAGTMTLAKSPTYADQTVTVPWTAYKIAEYQVITAGDDTFALGVLGLELLGSTTTVESLTDIYLVVGGTTTPGYATSTRVFFWIGEGETFAPNSTTKIDVYASLPSIIAGETIATQFVVAGVSYNSGEIVTTDIVGGQMITASSTTSTTPPSPPLPPSPALFSDWSNIQITDFPGDENVYYGEYPALTSSDNGYAVAWEGSDGSPVGENIFFQRLDIDGNPIGQALELSDHGYCGCLTAYPPNISWNGSEYGVAWIDVQLNTNGTIRGNYLRLVTINNSGATTSDELVRIEDGQGGVTWTGSVNGWTFSPSFTNGASVSVSSGKIYFNSTTTVNELVSAVPGNNSHPFLISSGAYFAVVWMNVQNNKLQLYFGSKRMGSSTPDTTAPVISNIATTNITESSAKITWTTDESADSKVYFLPAIILAGNDGGYGTSHSINLGNLSYPATYSYVVVSKDASGNTGTSSEQSFTTVGQTITAAQGLLNATIDASTPLAGIVVGNSMPKLASFKFSALNDSFTVTELTAKVASTSDAMTITELVFKDGSTELARVPFVGVYASSTGFSIVIPSGSSKVIDVYANLGSSSGANIGVTLSGYAAMSSSGVNSFENVDLVGNDIYVFRTRPTIRDVSLSATLSTGTKVLARFAIDADAGGTLAWRKLTANFTKSSSVSLGNFQIFDRSTAYDWSGFPIPGAQPVAEGVALSDGNTATFVSSVDQEIHAATTKVYEIRATVSGDLQSGDYVTTSVAPARLQYDPPTFLSGVASSSNIIWSDLSASPHSDASLDWNNDYFILYQSHQVEDRTLTY